MSIKKEALYRTQNGETVYRFRIPNQTGDYIELTNLGCAIYSIHVHDLSGAMENISVSVPGASADSKASKSGTLIGGELGKALSDKLWNIAAEEENSVLLACESLAEENPYNVDLQLGVRITWVNLNRLIIDFFLTPKENVAINFSCYLLLGTERREFLMRSFCPVVKNPAGDYLEVSETAFKNMRFVPLKNHSAVFISANDEIKPMLELSDLRSKLRISVYSTLTSVRVRDLLCQGSTPALTIVTAGNNPMDLKAGETLANRVIYGFDYIEEISEDDAEPNPFSFFTLG